MTTPELVGVRSELSVSCTSMLQGNPFENEISQETPPNSEAPKPKEPKVEASKCVAVSPDRFLRKVHGFWQRHLETVSQPSCTRDSSTNEIVRSFISFHSTRQNYSSFVVGYGTHVAAVQTCLNAPLGGAPLRPVEPISLELCQTEELVRELGDEYYFEKTHGLYRLVGTTTDTRNRVVLLLSGRRSSSPDIKGWLELPRPLYPYINHNDFRSVELRSF